MRVDYSTFEGFEVQIKDCGVKASTVPADKRDMTVSSAGLNSIQSGQSLLDRTAANVAQSTQPVSSSASPAQDQQDQVSLSADAVALIQARNEVAAGASLIHADNNLQKTLLDVIG